MKPSVLHPSKKFLLLFVVLLLTSLPVLQAEDLLSEAVVIERVLRQNLKAQGLALDPQIAATDITKAKSQFDTKLSGLVSYNIDRSDPSSIVFGTDNRQLLYEAKAEKKLPIGLQGALTFSQERDSTDSTFTTMPSFYESSLQLELSQPLLKNRWGTSDRRTVSLSEVQQEATNRVSLASLEDLVGQSLTQYWNWVATLEYVALSQRFLNLAQNFLNYNQQKFSLGLVEDTDIYAARAMVVERETEVLRAKHMFQNAQQQLLDTLNLEGSLHSRDRLASLETAPSKEESISLALGRRNDYQALLAEAKANNLQLAIAKDQKYPSLDLFSSLALNSVDPKYGKTLEEAFQADHPNWLVGLKFEMSLENKFAKGEEKRRQFEKAKLLLRIKDLERTIALQVDQQNREVSLQQKEVMHFQKLAGLQKQKLNAEMEKFNLGRSSSDIIVRFQDDLLSAEKKRLDATLRFKLALLDLKKVSAHLIPENLKIWPYDEAPNK